MEILTVSEFLQWCCLTRLEPLIEGAWSITLYTRLYSHLRACRSSFTVHTRLIRLWCSMQHTGYFVHFLIWLVILFTILWPTLYLLDMNSSCLVTLSHRSLKSPQAPLIHLVLMSHTGHQDTPCMRFSFRHAGGVQEGLLTSIVSMQLVWNQLKQCKSSTKIFGLFLSFPCPSHRVAWQSAHGSNSRQISNHLNMWNF